MRTAAMMLCLLLAGCEKPSAKLERQFEMADNVMQPGVKCRLARETADAYLREENKEQYELWNARAFNECGN